MIQERLGRMARVIDIVIPVYNDASYLVESLSSIFNQRLIDSWRVHVYVVDDGSDKAVKLDVPKDNAHRVSIVRLEKNSGCSVARNKGAHVGNGEVVLFLDADCSLIGSNVLALLLEQYQQGFDVCFGQIYAPQGDFWARYQNDVAKERAVKFRAGGESSMTTAVFMVKRKVFESVGGFDEEYHFGFEDRDLFLTLIKSGASVALEEKALVFHNDNLSLLSVTKKSYGAGKNSSTRFIQKHSEEYMKMSYAKVDTRYSTVALMSLVFLTKHAFWGLIAVCDRGVTKGFLPYILTKRIVKLSTGLAYLHGTAVAAKKQ